MTTQPFHVIIIGGGIGGLCLAQKLKQAGVSVSVYERDQSRTSRLQGYRIHINPSGSRALHESLPPRLYEIFLATCGKSGQGFNFLSEQLKELLFIGPDDPGFISEEDPVESHKSVSRFTLRQILLAGLEERVHFNKQFTHYEETSDGKFAVFFEDGTSTICDVLVGADGSNSRVRKQFLPQARRIDTGICAIQGKTLLTDDIRHLLPQRLFVGPASVIGPNGYSMFIAVQEFQHKPGEIEEIGEVIKVHPNLLLSDTSDFIGWGFIARQVKLPTQKDLKTMDGEDLKQVVLKMATAWHPLLQQLIREADPSTVLFTPIQTSLPIEHWQTKLVTLLGDAIHSMTPARGIGANTALRDSALLGRNLIAAHRGKMPLQQAIHNYEVEMLQYGFAAVLSSKKTLEQTASLEKPLPLAMTRVAFRFLNAVPPLKRRIFSGFGDS
ncbi:FAD-dependent monooxygenase [Ktedonosporobacter rubrisoli]|uniref:FAD-dependent monooxygenase n=1 Tax=Ktedonosporobacter rubrisoli TaxID=2509675 RepID=A0A4P6JPK8_KTERU|nr:FAD-dependent monooxygenase [Ktedonosporobacter rubrisoli]QBD77153.1 FAD-dependent monooxygenase [Ktedonosporobacter rubrisoli]